MAEPESPAAALRRAAKAARELPAHVLPAGIAGYLVPRFERWADAPPASQMTFENQIVKAAVAVLALAEQQQTRPRPFQVGDEVRWQWHEGGSGRWFQARLVECHPLENPTGWAGAITDPGTFYAPEHSDRPVGHVVFFSEPSMTLVAAAEEAHDV